MPECTRTAGASSQIDRLGSSCRNACTMSCRSAITNHLGGAARRCVAREDTRQKAEELALQCSTSDWSDERARSSALRAHTLKAASVSRHRSEVATLPSSAPSERMCRATSARLDSKAHTAFFRESLGLQKWRLSDYYLYCAR